MPLPLAALATKIGDEQHSLKIYKFCSTNEELQHAPNRPPLIFFPLPNVVAHGAYMGKQTFGLWNYICFYVWNE
jgi:hypothetical protein